MGLCRNRVFQSVFSQNNISLRCQPPYGAYFDYSNPTFEGADPSGGYVWDPTTYKASRITYSRVDPGLRMPEVQQYHLTIDRQFPSRWMLSVGYARTRGIGFQNQITNRAKLPNLSPQDGILYDKIDPDPNNTNPPPGYIFMAQPRTNQRRPDTRYFGVLADRQQCVELLQRAARHAEAAHLQRNRVASQLLVVQERRHRLGPYAGQSDRRIRSRLRQSRAQRFRSAPPPQSQCHLGSPLDAPAERHRR
jgi:hypothetical protein